MMPIIKLLFLCFISFHSLAATQGKANRLIHESSPYLLQHAYNPVDWYPWGEEAFAKARKENKPVFISIGYSTCHWCHVMAHESFENTAIAKILNQHFISIKVDREERPDIDRIYLTASEILAGYGGWPTTAITTTGLKPFFAGAYIPPESKNGQQGLKDILTKVVELWKNDRDNINTVADEVTELLRQQLATEQTEGKLNASSVTLSYQHFAKTYDNEYGGFGNAPKFPRMPVFDFLLSYGKQHSDSHAHKMISTSFDYMIRGGITDQVGGGFHRYSVDAEWQVPHFEKMLYDQGLITNTLIDASLALQTERYHSTIRQSLDFVLANMQDPLGGFYSAFDADSARPGKPGEHGEGAYYVWDKKELDNLLNKKEQKLFYAYYNIQDNGNVASDPQNEFTNLNILHAETSLYEIAKSLSIKPEAAQTILQSSLQKLKQQRDQRPPPHLDDKIITSWNALIIRSLAKASSLLNEKRYLLAAEKSAHFIHRNLYNPATQTLYRSFRKNKTSGEAYLDDYAYLINSLLHLFKQTQNRQWLVWADTLMQQQIALFHDKTHHGFFDNTNTDKNILFRSKEIYDGSLPSANAISAENLLLLSGFNNKPQWKTLALKTINAFHQHLNELIENYPQMYRSYLLTRSH